jgi:hypothetical protein
MVVTSRSNPSTPNAGERRRAIRDRTRRQLARLALVSPLDLDHAAETWRELALVKDKRLLDSGTQARTPADVRRARDATLDRTVTRAQVLASGLRAGLVTGDEWFVAMAQTILDVHLYAAALALGGWRELTPDAITRVTAIVRRQLGYLNRFGQQVAEGLVLDGRFLSRAGLYIDAGRGTYWSVVGEVMAGEGKRFERNVLHPAEHCQGCLDESARGWVAIGALVPIGDRDCLGRCRCTIEYAADLPGA